MDFVLDGDGPLYRQIRRAIADPILAGHLPPGTRLPSEHELMDTFATARMTVNRALQMLVDEGLVERQRRNGTFVAEPSASHAVVEISDIADEVVKSGAKYSYKRLRSRTLKFARAIMFSERRLWAPCKAGPGRSLSARRWAKSVWLS